MEYLNDHERTAFDKMLQGLPKDTEGENSNRQEEDYRQILFLTDYKSDYEAELVSAAISEAWKNGLSLAPIMNWVINR